MKWYGVLLRGTKGEIEEAFYAISTSQTMATIRVGPTIEVHDDITDPNRWGFELVSFQPFSILGIDAFQIRQGEPLPHRRLDGQ